MKGVKTMTEYTLWRNGKLQGTYDGKPEAMNAWDKLVGYAIAPDMVRLKKDDHILSEYTPMPERNLR